MNNGGRENPYTEMLRNYPRVNGHADNEDFGNGMILFGIVIIFSVLLIKFGFIDGKLNIADFGYSLVLLAFGYFVRNNDRSLKRSMRKFEKWLIDQETNYAENNVNKD